MNLRIIIIYSFCSVTKIWLQKFFELLVILWILGKNAWTIIIIIQIGQRKTHILIIKQVIANSYCDLELQVAAFLCWIFCSPNSYIRLKETIAEVSENHLLIPKVQNFWIQRLSTVMYMWGFQSHWWWCIKHYRPRKVIGRESQCHQHEMSSSLFHP